MSATSPTLHSDASISGSTWDIRAKLSRLSFRRRLLQACQKLMFGVSSLFVLLLAVGVVDYVWNIRRAFRLALTVPLLLGFFVLLTYAVLSLARRRNLGTIARDVERAARRNDNALVTFAETLETPSGLGTERYMLSRLAAQARASLASIDVNSITSRRGALHGVGLLTLVMVLLFALRIIVPTAFAREWRRILWLESDHATFRSPDDGSVSDAGNNAIVIESFRVRVVPPSYSGLGIEETSGDAPLRALAGSEIEVDMSIRGKFRAATLGFGGTTSQMRALGEGAFGGSFLANSSGVLEAQVRLDEEQTPISIVRAIEVYADSPPEARITLPASDQLLRAVPQSPVAVRWTARDDLGLANVLLKYIRSRGEGDSAQFVNGSIPLAGVDRSSALEWSGGASLELSRLGLQPGDTLVYWIEASDRNPSTNNTGRSASLAIAITAPEPVKLNLGDLGPNEIGRFLISQRMIIIHTESLHAKRSRLPREEFLREANIIAAEQRDFKNSFNEYIKLEGIGEETQDSTNTSPESVEERVREADEERTGIHMHGIPEPPAGSPSNVRDMVYAIRAMWDAENALSLGETAKALVHEREALTRLKRAQLAVRYVPPVFARSKPIDLKRRYAGELNEIKTRLERLSRAPESKDSMSLRTSLAQAYAALAELQATLTSPVTARVSAVARARDSARQSASSMAGVGGDHAATIAESLAQLRIVESELSRLEVGGTADDYAMRLSKPLTLLTKVVANLFAIAEARTRASSGEVNTVLPTDEGRTSEYFRRLNK